MTFREQAQFISELTENVKQQMLRTHASGKIPENWDGIELRQYIADKFSQCIIKSTMSRTRKREYNNTVTVNNL